MARPSLEEAILRLRRRLGRRGTQSGLSLEARLASLEREMAEVKARINGLIFVVLGAVISELLTRLLQ
ncbi:hypothetical protein HRbin25_00030 [bacterium HR25]|jgi:guanylate kinase|nr:hypothetical protein HRbin25_00030 [bacterium HR25]